MVTEPGGPNRSQPKATGGGDARPGRRCCSSSAACFSCCTWLVVHVTVENVGDREQAFLNGNQKILCDDKEYGGEAFTWNGSNAEDLNPGVVLGAALMFDLPDGFPNLGAGTTLELHDSAFPGGVNVSL